MTERDDERFRNYLERFGPAGKTTGLFRRVIYHFYRRHGRDLPWRKTRDPYRILVSEVMLQQTQVERVLTKYPLFIKTFPDFRSLASASLSEVLRVWQGLGYNRRALALKRLAEKIVKDYGGRLPSRKEALTPLPGIGPYTASAILAFAHNRPEPLVETNIRSVFIHFFFQDRAGIGDGEIMRLVAGTIDKKNPREWYYALMDYGAKLKKEVVNPGRRSAHHRPQTPFRGSRRQIRGMMLREVAENGGTTRNALVRAARVAPEVTDLIIEELIREGFVRKEGRRLVIS